MSLDLCAALRAAVDAALAAIGDPGPWAAVGGLGGSQSAVVRLRAPSGDYVLKHGMPGAMATAEARGLRLLADTRAIRVPKVVAAGEHPPFVLLEHLSGDAHFDEAALGESLAALHRHGAPSFGLDHDNFIGRTPQTNTPADRWLAFFRDCRLCPQIDLAARAGRLPPGRAAALERLVGRLGDHIDDAGVVPSLIHGDLWHGNAVAAGAGRPALIDPAVSYSDREAELGMMLLFGGFSSRCFDAYHAAWPLAPGWRERAELYGLYHWLNHLNLFGEAYGGGVDAVLRRFG
jgi:fructosamine-3-kinase